MRALGFVMVLILAGCGSGGPDAPPAMSSTTLPRPATVPPSTTVPPTPTTTLSGDLGEAVGVFQEWVSALARGDTRLAWDLMSPSSRAALGEYARFAEMGTGLAEGWGTWVAVEDPSYNLEEDEAGRTLLVASGTIRPEGIVEEREVGVPVVRKEGRLLVSPFEEFGNVAEGLDEPDDVAHPIPAHSGEGRRIVYSNSSQRVWLVEEDGTIRDSYLVSGRKGVPSPGTYEVFSKSEVAFAGHDGITMTHMVRFAHGRNLDIGFHAIPNDGRGRPLQSEDALGEYRSAGCVRQSPGHAAALFDWAGVGTKVVVLP